MRKTLIFLSFVFLITSVISLTINGQSRFDERTAFQHMLRSNPTMIGSYLQEYLYRFENAQYHIYANDEFECFRATEQLTKNVSSISTDNVFYIETSANFGVYDFTNESFEFSPVNLAEPMEIVKYQFTSKGKTNSKIDIHFNNGDEITRLPLKKDQANYLVKLKKNQKTGKIERVVDIRIYFNVEQRAEIDNGGTRTKCDLFVNVLNVDVHDNPDFAAEPLVSLPTIYKVQKDAASAAKAQASK